MPETRTGRLVNHDPLSRGFEHSRRAIQPKSVLHTLNAPALDQGALSACVGFAGAQWLNCAKNVTSRTVYNRSRLRSGSRYTDNDEGRDLYHQATVNDDFNWEWPVNDDGSSGIGIAKALKLCGAINRYEWTFSFAGLLAALQVQPVIVGTVWTDSMFEPDSRGRIQVTRIDSATGGHEYLLRGIDWSHQLVRIRNNWTPGWGINGDAYISFIDMEQLLKAQGDCLVPIGLTWWG